ncbi:MAG TPA: aminoacetone oxidase family FAD-binding enzyme, partial [Bacteroidia bacterium]|nr:aminoacetone oxidase family FAD-binding enzyme [Bacteroidia bacterium]
MRNTLDLLVIGGGAAGFFAAANVAEQDPSLRVAILEKTGKLLSKVRISGGGRCNVTHACFDNRLLSEFYPRGNRELLQAFSRFSPAGTIEWFSSHGVELKTEEDGRMFPVTDNSLSVVSCLTEVIHRNNVEVHLHCGVEKISKKENFFEVTAGGSVFHSENVLIAAGGNPSSGFYDFIRETGHVIVPPVPSLFTFNIRSAELASLMGISVPGASVEIKEANIFTEGPVLITHWGLSGPAILKASSLGAKWMADRQYNFEAAVNWLNPAEAETVFEELKWIKMQHPRQKV